MNKKEKKLLEFLQSKEDANPDFSRIANKISYNKTIKNKKFSLFPKLAILNCLAVIVLTIIIVPIVINNVKNDKVYSSSEALNQNSEQNTQQVPATSNQATSTQDEAASPSDKTITYNDEQYLLVYVKDNIIDLLESNDIL